MATTISVDAKILGQKRPLVTDWIMDLPPLWENGGSRQKLRDLITAIVIEEVHGYQKRQEEHKLARILSGKEIEQGVQQGKVDAGEHNFNQFADQESAITTALQAFEDGLYYVFIDAVQQTDLDKEVFLKTQSKVVFIRLVALAGG